MNTPESGYSHLFTTMVETPENRTAFIKSALEFVEKYGFNGIDIDWVRRGAAGARGCGVGPTCMQRGHSCWQMCSCSTGAAFTIAFTSLSAVVGQKRSWLDWLLGVQEYPGDEARGGRAQDKDNYPLLLKVSWGPLQCYLGWTSFKPSGSSGLVLECTWRGEGLLTLMPGNACCSGLHRSCERLSKRRGRTTW